MALDDDIKALARLPLFAVFDRDALRLIAFSAETRQLAKGDVLVRRGERLDGGYLVVSGSLTLQIQEGVGPTRIIGRDMLLDEAALLTETESGTTAIAREASAILKVPRVLFHRVLKEAPDAAARLHDLFHDRLQTILGELGTTRRRFETPADQ